MIALTKSGRILAAMEANRNETVISLAESLSRALDAEVLGVYVEDEEIFIAASLPFTSTISPETGEVRRLLPEDLERAFRASAEQLRRSLFGAGPGARAGWSLEVVRGAGETAVLARAGKSDVVVLRRRRHGALAEILRTASCSIAVASAVGRQHPDRRHVVILYNGSALHLRVAARLAATIGGRLTVLIVHEDSDQRSVLRRRARAWLNRNAVAGDLDAIETAAVRDRLRHLGGGVLVAGLPVAGENGSPDALLREEDDWALVLLHAH
jgi:hypothetical protein